MRYNQKLRLFVGLMTVSSLLTLESCREPEVQLNQPSGTANARLSAESMVYVLTDNNQLIKVSTQNPSTALETIAIKGVQNSERLVGIDFRPATGQLYGISNGSRLYMINLANGVATALGTGAISPAINGDVVGFDFNPTVDRIRLVTNRGQNLRLNPETGTTAATDGNLNGVAGGVAVSGVAYTNNRSGVTTTTLYDIDPITDKLYRQDPPNAGTLVEVGSLGIDIAGTGSFDIAPNGDAVAVLINNNMQGFYEINLSTGRAERLGNLPTTASIVGLAIPTDPVAYTADGLNNLIIFNPMAPAPISKAITGLQPGESIFGLDFRPANGQLYALGSMNRIYTINTSNGAATLVGSGPFSPSLAGNDVGFDFNPTVDRIRLVTNSGQDLRLNPNDGTVAAIDGALNPGSPNVTAVAYTNNFAGSTSTTLYDIDTRTNNAMLVIQSPPNNGTLAPVGATGISAEGGNGFDIGGTSNIGYALMRSNGSTNIYAVNLSSGAVTLMSSLPGNPSV
ncbi:DUF4394 domain-containing protein, partial [Spirosoma sp.]|uniref:DUF4394 domain-containing protein n=1 Tax=Spirosoma sp. TaxID=1899569 RepID=UPI003B3ADC39